MKRIPTDREILDHIYDRYYQTFTAFSKGKPTRSSKNYVPIDIDQLAEDLHFDADLTFGRLYYHLDKKYRYKQDDGSSVHLFTLKVGDDTHCVHFPYLVSVLAGFRAENRKFLIATTIAITSLIVAAVSIWFSVVR